MSLAQQEPKQTAAPPHAPRRQSPASSLRSVSKSVTDGFPSRSDYGLDRETQGEGGGLKLIAGRTLMMDWIEIDGRRIGQEHPPYIIAEVSSNHGGDIERAKRIIRLAAECGADAVKFQAYTADEMTLNIDRRGFVVTADSPWKGESLYALYQRAATPYAWFPELFKTARDAGVTPFASPFGPESVAMLEGLAAPVHKIASFEAVDLDLIALCAATGKPLIISTGLCTREEIADAVAAARSGGAKQIALLRCNSSYPSDPEEAHLATIPDMAAEFALPIGYSDHTLDQTQAAVAVALGACIVEKHVIDAREPETADSAFSCLPEQLEDLVRVTKAAWRARGRVSYGPQEKERGSLEFRRSLYAVADIAAGELFSAANVRTIRPGLGLPPKVLPDLLGRPAARALRAGDPLSWEDVAQ
ncbi:MAG: pseudaminic acid synthase [Marivibrio sp.]|uniref:pseudaminic acid synthase n=1 Tax=Marivibrio sp. TaxID=2039719 RepID=UPI0032EE52F0